MKKYLSILLLLMGSVEGKKVLENFFTEENEPEPWFTGPLLTPSGHVVPFGHQNYEPYFYYIETGTSYDGSWHTRSVPYHNSVLFQETIQIGVLPDTEFDLSPQFLYNHTSGERDWRVADLPIALAFQLYQDSMESGWPAIKLRFGANLLIGKYNHLSAAKKGTDVGGNGNWRPGVGFIITHLYRISGVQFFAWRYWINWNVTVPIPVRGINVFGGTKKTHGTVYPGNSILSIMGFEYSLSRSWALALDVQYSHHWRNRFSGNSGGGILTEPSRDLFSLAPAIEYNFNANIGLIAGPWFSIAGRNTSAFMQWVLAINVYN